MRVRWCVSCQRTQITFLFKPHAPLGPPLHEEAILFSRTADANLPPTHFPTALLTSESAPCTPGRTEENKKGTLGQ
ncbi:hypothetical protein ACRRTK_015839 [Alexandromys fortis]